MLTTNGVTVDLAKIEAVSEWKQPQNVTEIKSFLGLAGYYRRFIENISKIAKPMTELLWKNAPLCGTKHVSKASKNSRSDSLPLPSLPYPILARISWYIVMLPSKG